MDYTPKFYHFLYGTGILYFFRCFWRARPFSLVGWNHTAFYINPYLLFFTNAGNDNFCHSNNSASYVFDTRNTKRTFMDLYGNRICSHLLYLHYRIYRKLLGKAYIRAV